MAVDGIILDKIVQDLQSKLPAKINKIHQISKTEIIFTLRCNREKANLMVSCHSVYNRIHFTKKQYDNLDEPTNFNLILRKYLDGGIIYKIEQIELDRYIKMEIDHRNQIGDKETLFLYIELMGKYANLILVNQNNKIIDALKRIPPYENSIRVIHPGAEYIKPASQHKLDPFSATEYDANNSLVAQFRGLSPLLAKEIEFRLSTNSFADIMETIAASNSLYISKTKQKIEYHIIPLLHLKTPAIQYPLHEGFDEFYFQIANKELIKQVTGNLYKTLNRQIKILNKKLPKLLESYDDALDCDIHKEYGNLLYSYPDIQTKGKNQVTIIDFEGKEVTIPTNAKLDTKQNAQKQFQKYNKLKKGQSYILDQINLTKNEITYLSAILEQLEFSSVKDANEIKEELEKNHYLKANQKVKNKKKKKAKIPNITIINYQDYEIAFGKNNLQNDYITFKYAKKNYTWFHAKDYHGAHVVINSDQPSEKAIRYCANIAAYYSKGRFSSSVPVNYCLVRQLKKIPGSKLGLVSLSNYKTIYIDPEEV